LRTYIFTKREEAILKGYLERGEKPKDFYDLVHRIRRDIERIGEHYTLMRRVLEKFESS